MCSCFGGGADVCVLVVDGLETPLGLVLLLLVNFFLLLKRMLLKCIFCSSLLLLTAVVVIFIFIVENVDCGVGKAIVYFC